MDLFAFDNVKTEKANAMIRYRRLQKIAKLFRLFELCLALVFVSWFSTRLPNVVEISGKFFKELCVILISPRFVFLIGNAIVLTLFAKSGQFSGQNRTGSYLYEEFVKNSEKIGTESTEEIVFQDKPVISEEILVKKPVFVEKKIYRSQSENMKREVSEKTSARELRRSVTVEKCRKVEASVKEAARRFEEEDMSNEEFNRKIEEFIAKQVRFHKEESMAIVLKSS